MIQRDDARVFGADDDPLVQDQREAGTVRVKKLDSFSVFRTQDAPKPVTDVDDFFFTN